MRVTVCLYVQKVLNSSLMIGIINYWEGDVLSRTYLETDQN